MARLAWLRSWVMSFVFAGWVVIILGVFALGFVTSFLIRSVTTLESEFQATSQRSSFAIVGELLAGATQPSQEVYRFLILGTDEVAGSNRPNVLTDTIVVVSYRPQDNTVRMTSLPRDLYLPQYGSRLNGLYSQSLEKGLRSTFLPENAVEELLGLSIDGTVVVRMADIAQLIDIIGGVTVAVPNTFEDPLYPRDGVDVTVERDPKVLYEPLRFEAGEQHFDGATAVKYARTRHSSDPTEGSDQARIRRQQQVVQAITDKLSQQETLTQPKVIGSLYRLYSDHFASAVPLSLMGRVLRDLSGTSALPEFISISLPATDLPAAPDLETIFIHPPLAKYRGQWVYELSDPSGQQLRQHLLNQQL